MRYLLAVLLLLALTGHAAENVVLIEDMRCERAAGIVTCTGREVMTQMPTMAKPVEMPLGQAPSGIVMNPGVSIGIPPGYTLKIARRKTNRSREILITVNRDMLVAQ